MSPKAPAIAQRQVWLVDLPSTLGHEAAGRRPALVVQADGMNRSRWQSIVVVPLTRTMSRAALTGSVIVPAGEAALPERSVAVGLWITAIDRARFLKPFGTVSRERFRKVIGAIADVVAESA